MTDQNKINKALRFAHEYGQIDGGHHKLWVIDQMVRALHGSPMVTKSAIDYQRNQYTYEDQGESKEYTAWVQKYCEWDASTEEYNYSWETGSPP